MCASQATWNADEVGKYGPLNLHVPLVSTIAQQTQEYRSTTASLMVYKSMCSSSLQVANMCSHRFEVTKMCRFCRHSSGHKLEEKRHRPTLESIGHATWLASKYSQAWPEPLWTPEKAQTIRRCGLCRRLGRGEAHLYELSLFAEGSKIPITYLSELIMCWLIITSRKYLCACLLSKTPIICSASEIALDTSIFTDIATPVLHILPIYVVALTKLGTI